jgi:hypothetical protein
VPDALFERIALATLCEDALGGVPTGGVAYLFGCLESLVSPVTAFSADWFPFAVKLETP